MPDNGAPWVAITGPGEGDEVAGTVTVTADAGAARGVSRVEFYVDGVYRGRDTRRPFAYAWNTTELSNGAHRLEAVAIDGGGTRSAPAAVAVVVKNLRTESFSGSLGGRGQPLARSHSVTVELSGPLELALTWSGGGDLDLAVWTADGASLVAAAATIGGRAENASLIEVPAGTYTLVVTAASGSARYKLTVRHY